MFPEEMPAEVVSPWTAVERSTRCATRIAAQGLAGWAGDGMTQPPTSSPDLAAPRERDELLATKVNIPRTRPPDLLDHSCLYG